MISFRKTILTAAALTALLLPFNAIGRVVKVQPVAFDEVRMGGELRERVERNFRRLEEEKYQPDHVFLTEAQSNDWPGDTEGRTILALVLDAQAGRLQPRYLDEIMRRIPDHLNEKGYMGTIHSGLAHEQQLSGNGWMLRALCEYYQWKGGDEVLRLIRSTVDSLFLDAAPLFATYPIAPDERKQGIGAESGSIAATSGRWMLSTDIGCVFIGMEGLIHAYAVLKDARLRKPIEALLDKFLALDLTGIRAQTHATLTACRGLIRYADATGYWRCVDEAARRFNIYRENGMTENFENYNWFDRFDTWTEPCAIVDSYMLAVQLWQHTLDPSYLDVAEEIYYNALCHTQRFNGGFGCDNCPGLATATSHLGVHAPEAHWCCTMRGGEGLSSAVRYSLFKDSKGVYLPFYHEAAYDVRLSSGRNLAFQVSTSYPFNQQVQLNILQAPSSATSIRLALRPWMENVKLTLDGRELPLPEAKWGFLELRRRWVPGQVLELSYTLRAEFRPVLNRKNAEESGRRAFYGPLLLGCEGEASEALPEHPRLEQTGPGEWGVTGTGLRLTPVYHLMDSKVWTGTGYKKRILF